MRRSRMTDRVGADSLGQQRWRGETGACNTRFEHRVDAKACQWLPSPVHEDSFLWTTPLHDPRQFDRCPLPERTTSDLSTLADDPHACPIVRCRAKVKVRDTQTCRFTCAGT